MQSVAAATVMAMGGGDDGRYFKETIYIHVHCIYIPIRGKIAQQLY